MQYFMFTVFCTSLYSNSAKLKFVLKFILSASTVVRVLLNKILIMTDIQKYTKNKKNLQLNNSTTLQNFCYRLQGSNLLETSPARQVSYGNLWYMVLVICHSFFFV